MFDAKISNNIIIEISSTIIGGVIMSDKKFVSIGIVITIQYQAHLVGSPYENIYSAALYANMELANEYKEKRY